jgi:hypothetical protein
MADGRHCLARSEPQSLSLLGSANLIHSWLRRMDLRTLRLAIAYSDRSDIVLHPSQGAVAPIRHLRGIGTIRAVLLTGEKNMSRVNDCYAIGEWLEKTAQGWAGENGDRPGRPCIHRKSQRDRPSTSLMEVKRASLDGQFARHLALCTSQAGFIVSQLKRRIGRGEGGAVHCGLILPQVKVTGRSRRRRGRLSRRRSGPSKNERYKNR